MRKNNKLLNTGNYKIELENEQIKITVLDVINNIVLTGYGTSLFSALQNALNKDAKKVFGKQTFILN